MPDSNLPRGTSRKLKARTDLRASNSNVVQQAKLMDSAGTAWHAVKYGNLELITKLFPSQCDVYNKGPVGENVFHVAMLLNTPSTLAIAKYLVKLYGTTLVNTPYQERKHEGDTAGQYEGETAIHIAIVNRDFDMVKFLIQNGADVRARAYGGFFQEGSIMYYGEFPFSFAACTGQKDIVSYLKRHGARVNGDRDTSGNSALHMCVYHEQQDMYDHLVEYCGASEHVRNNRGQTPLLLAASLGKQDMFQHIYNRRRRVAWAYGPVTSYSLSLHEIDTVQNRNIFVPSALEEIVRKAHMDSLNDPLIKTLLETKWDRFARNCFAIQMALYLIFVVLQTFLIWLHGDALLWNTYSRQALEVVAVIFAGVFFLLECLDLHTWTGGVHNRSRFMKSNATHRPPLYHIPGDMAEEPTKGKRGGIFSRMIKGAAIAEGLSPRSPTPDPARLPLSPLYTSSPSREFMVLPGATITYPEMERLYTHKQMKKQYKYKEREMMHNEEEENELRGPLSHVTLATAGPAAEGVETDRGSTPSPRAIKISPSSKASSNSLSSQVQPSQAKTTGGSSSRGISTAAGPGPLAEGAEAGDVNLRRALSHQEMVVPPDGVVSFHEHNIPLDAHLPNVQVQMSPKKKYAQASIHSSYSQGAHTVDIVSVGLASLPGDHTCPFGFLQPPVTSMLGGAPKSNAKENVPAPQAYPDTGSLLGVQLAPVSGPHTSGPTREASVEITFAGNSEIKNRLRGGGRGDIGTKTVELNRKPADNQKDEVDPAEEGKRQLQDKGCMDTMKTWVYAVRRYHEREMDDPIKYMKHLHVLLTFIHFITWASTYGGVGGSGPTSEGTKQFDDIILSLVGLTGWLSILYFTRGQKDLGVMSVILEWCLKDTSIFVVVFFLADIGFTLAFYSLLSGTTYTTNPGEMQPTAHNTLHAPFSNIGHGMMECLRFLYGEANYDAFTDTEYTAKKAFATIYFILYVFFVVLMLSFMLIASIMHTFNSRLADAEKVWLLRWATYVLRMERRLPLGIQQKIRLGEVRYDNQLQARLYSHVFEVVDDNKDEAKGDQQVKALETMLDQLKSKGKK